MGGARDRPPPPGVPVIRDAAGTAAPLDDGEVRELLAPLSRYRNLVLAISGGADSLALLSIIARWLGLPGSSTPTVVAVTVDHRLRAASGAEARHVAMVATQLRIPHRTVVWDSAEAHKGGGGLQAAARNARYALLGAVAEASDTTPVAIVTAHTRDDQAETLVMRLKRGSGLDGLAGIPPRRALSPGSRVTIERPLLGVERVRLVATLAAAGIDWIDDPSNRDHRFERVRTRNAMGLIAEHGLTAAALAESARRLERARRALEAMTAAFLAEAVTIKSGVYAAIDRGRYDAAPEDIRIRALAEVLGWFGNAGDPPRLDQIEALVGRSLSPAFRGETLGGAMLRARPGDFVVFREMRERLGELMLSPGERGIWDGRFEVALAEDATEQLVVSALAAAGVHELRGICPYPADMPARAAEGIPAFRRTGGEIVAVPALAYVRPGGEVARCRFMRGFVGRS